LSNRTFMNAIFYVAKTGVPKTSSNFLGFVLFAAARVWLA